MRPPCSPTESSSAGCEDVCEGASEMTLRWRLLALSWRPAIRCFSLCEVDDCRLRGRIGGRGRLCPLVSSSQSRKSVSRRVMKLR